jgi:hypothetical protein
MPAPAQLRRRDLMLALGALDVAVTGWCKAFDLAD